MQHSQEIGKISAAIAKAQGKIEPAVFDRENPFHKNRYATLNSVISAVKSELTANEIAVFQGTDISEDGGLIVETMLTHSSGEWIKSAIKMHPKDNSPQSVGSAITYARRYLLAAMTCNSSEEDDDANAATPTNQTRQQPRQTPVKASPTVKPTTNTTRKADTPRTSFETVSEGIPSCTGTDALEIQRLASKLGAVDKASVLKMIAGVIGREIKSSAELTRDEAKKVIGTLFERVTEKEEGK